MLPTVPAVALTPEMAKSLRSAGRNVEKWTDERNRLIREAVAAGGSLREVGEAAGLTHTAVKLICERS